jgi:hypothetical protein
MEDKNPTKVGATLQELVLDSENYKYENKYKPIEDIIELIEAMIDAKKVNQNQNRGNL